jgi:hypothetical protein
VTFEAHFHGDCAAGILRRNDERVMSAEKSRDLSTGTFASRAFSLENFDGITEFSEINGIAEINSRGRAKGYTCCARRMAPRSKLGAWRNS